MAAIKQIILILKKKNRVKKYQLYVEERVYRKFEIKLKLTVNDLLFGYKGHSQHFIIPPPPPHTHTKKKKRNDFIMFDIYIMNL